MSRILFGTISLLRPEDEDLTAEEAFQVQVYRLLTLFGAGGLLLFGIARRTANPDAVDPIEARLAVVGLCLGLFGVSYLSSWVRRTYVEWAHGVMFVIMGWVTVVAALNGFAGSYTVGLLLAFAALMAAIGFGAGSMQPVYWFIGFGLALLTVGVLVVPAVQMSPVLILASLVTMALAQGGVIKGWLTARSSLDKRQKREQELARSREYTDRILDAFGDIFFVQDSQANLRRWNDSFRRVTGYSDEEIADMKGVDFVPEDHRDRAAEGIQRVFDEGHARLEAPLLRKDGTTIPYEYVASRVEHPEGTERLVGIGRDISERKARERELKDSRERWQRLVESHQDGIQISIGGEIRYINPAGAQILGADVPAQVVGEPLGRFLGADQKHGAMDERMKRLTKGEPTEPHEQEVLGLDGERRIVESYSLPIDFEGRAATQTVFRDVTARHEMEEQLRERRGKIESLYKATSRLLTAERKEAVSKRVDGVLRDVFGYPLTGIHFVRDACLVPERVTLPDGAPMPEDRSLDVEGDSVAARAYRSGQTVVVEERGELENNASYGDVRSVAGVPLGEYGVLVIGQVERTIFDPFDLRLIEILSAQATVVLNGLERLEALQASEERFRGIFENTAVGIGVVDAKGHILDVNPALSEMTGYETSGLQGGHFEVISHPEDIDKDRELFEELLERKRDRYQIEKRYLRKGGEVFWGRLTVSRHEGRNEGQVIGMVEDIDHQKRYEEELREAKEDAERMNRLKSAFLANMSHEIRTPLTSIIGFAEAIGDEVEHLQQHADSPGLDTLDEFSGLIKQGGQRLMETLDAVLNLSKLEAGEMQLTLEPVDLANEVEETAKLFERQAEESGLALKTSYPERPLEARADEGGLRIALRNLVSNAIKYTGEGGQVWIRADADNGDALVEVEDTGVGMDPDAVPALFEAFKQESEGVGREYEGSGLGLAVTQRVIEQMDASIEVETEKGEGTCFTLRIPLAD